jgi:hypothetical protein
MLSYLIIDIQMTAIASWLFVQTFLFWQHPVLSLRVQQMNTHAHKQKKAVSVWQLLGEALVFCKNHLDSTNKRINMHFFTYLPVPNRNLQLSNKQSCFIIGSLEFDSWPIISRLLKSIEIQKEKLFFGIFISRLHFNISFVFFVLFPSFLTLFQIKEKTKCLRVTYFCC